MTFVGRILVVVIMAFALIFMGISAVVFTASTNWKEQTKKEQDNVAKLKKSVADANEKVAASEKDLEAAKKGHDAEKQTFSNRVAQLDADIKNAQKEATDAKDQLGLTQKNMQVALDEANSKKSETDLLRSQKADVEKQANEYKLRVTELNDKIREQERIIESAKHNATDLRDRNARLSALLRSKGLSDDISQVKPGDSPPPVEGVVKQVKGNRSIEVSIGSDDGIVPGHELNIYRTKPRPEYLGKIRIQIVDPDQAVGVVVGKTVQGKKIQEGDIVSSTLRPRS